jgi:predicted HNH restriction endonuclease
MVSKVKMNFFKEFEKISKPNFLTWIFKIGPINNEEIVPKFTREAIVVTAVKNRKNTKKNYKKYEEIAANADFQEKMNQKNMKKSPPTLIFQKKIWRNRRQRWFSRKKWTETCTA